MADATDKMRAINKMREGFDLWAKDKWPWAWFRDAAWEGWQAAIAAQQPAPRVPDGPLNPPIGGSIAPGFQAPPAPSVPEGQLAGFIKPDTDKQVFFYEQNFYVLSNFSAFTLQWRGHRFDTSEAAYHWEKFVSMPEGDPICDAIRFAPSAHQAFKIAEEWKSRRRRDWDAVKVDVMRAILIAKANQHEYVRSKLLATGNRELIEDSWRDDFWGWGPNRDGQNILGKLWMEVRAMLAAPEVKP